MRAVITLGVIGLGFAITGRVVGTQEGTVAQDPASSSFLEVPVTTADAPVEAPTGFQLVSNGVTTPAEFAEALEEFTGPETIADGLGPVFNAAGCGECHLAPIIGGSSQIAERRAGLFANGIFTPHPGGSLIQDRATDPRVQESVLPAHANVVALRASISVLGDGFVEAVGNTTLETIRNNQPPALRGIQIRVPVLEAPGETRIGRFGWKTQHASLLSFSGDAYAGEMGISTPLFRVENTVNGQPLPPGLDPFPGEPNVTDDTTNEDLDLFAAFMRSTLAPPVDADRAATAQAQRGSQLFNSLGCATCHTRTMVTVTAGTLINGGAFVVPPALGNKIIHPFSDFQLHDLGTGDGIQQEGLPSTTRLRMRTAALWGMRTRGRFMHDFASQSVLGAIDRHRGQADGIRSSFFALSGADRDAVIAFLLSL